MDRAPARRPNCSITPTNHDGVDFHLLREIRGNAGCRGLSETFTVRDTIVDGAFQVIEIKAHYCAGTDIAYPSVKEDRYGYWPVDRGDNHELVNEQSIDAQSDRRFETQQVRAVGSVSDCVDRYPVLRPRVAVVVARTAMRRH